MSDWFQIVDRYPDFHMGPTIPFVLGATLSRVGRRPFSERAAKNLLSDLLATIHREATLPGLGVRLVWCANVHSHVITPNPFDDRFSWNPVDGCAEPDYDGLLEVVWNRYGDAIAEGTYSLEDRVWRRFSREERLKIKATLRAGC